MGQPISLRQIIETLDVGESYCLARRLDQDTATSEHIKETRESLHNTARAAMKRASDATGRTYTGEVGEFRTTRDHDPVLCFLITRTA